MTPIVDADDRGRMRIEGIVDRIGSDSTTSTILSRRVRLVGDPRWHWVVASCCSHPLELMAAERGDRVVLTLERPEGGAVDAFRNLDLDTGLEPPRHGFS